MKTTIIIDWENHKIEVSRGDENNLVFEPDWDKALVLVKKEQPMALGNQSGQSHDVSVLIAANIKTASK
jgi:hypothetical protein